MNIKKIRIWLKEGINKPSISIKNVNNSNISIRIDGKEKIKQFFYLCAVSHRRELLISFAEYLKDRALINVTKENLPIRVDLYLKRD